jgi:hypothetical protein
MAIAALLLLFGVVLISGVRLVRLFDQAKHDRNRKTYTVAFPADLSTEAVMAWVRSISGTMQSGPIRLQGVPSMVFEVWATDRGMIHRLKVPWQQADYIVSQLRSLVPGVRVSPEEDQLWHDWTAIVELGETRPSRSLRINSSDEIAASLLASVQALDEGEAVLIQWVVSPAVPERPPATDDNRMSNDFSLRNILGVRPATSDEMRDRRDKLNQPNMLAVLRVAARANTEPRAKHLTRRVQAVLASVRSPYNRFKVRSSNTAKLMDRVVKGSAPLVFPAQLSASELVSLIGWPLGSPHVAGLPQGRTRHLAATESIPRQGRVVGVSNFPGAERPLAITAEDSCKHLHVVGPTGVGKTTLLANLVAQDIVQGHGVVLMESKGDLFYAALDYIPKERLDDVIILDVTDSARPVGFNILGQGAPRAVVDELCALFDNLYKDARGVWTREVMFHGLSTLISKPGLSFVDLAPLLVPMTTEESAWRDDMIRGLEDKELRNFWQRFDNQPRATQDRITQPVMDRIWQLNARPEIRNIIGQSQSSFTMEDVVKEGKVLLINLSGLGQETASLTGTLLINALWSAVKRSRLEKPTFLYLDEFQDFLQLPVSPEDMLAKARSFGLGMVLAHQHLGQLPVDVRQAVLANARSKVVFQTSSEDARSMQREFGRSVDENDFMHLGKHEAIARLASGDGVSAPVTMATKPPAERLGYNQTARQKSRERFGRAVVDVEAEITARRTVDGSGKPKRRPKIGSDSWG